MRFPSWLTWYKKPEYRDIKAYADEVRTGQRSMSPDGRGKTAIPSRLKLERVLENKTCSPMSLYDFHMYLKYIELSAENLEFYIWFKNYQSEWAKNGSTDFADEKDYGSVHSSNESSTASIIKPGDRSDKSFDESLYADDIVAAETAMERVNKIIGGATGKCVTGKCDITHLETPSPSKLTTIKNKLTKPQPVVTANTPINAKTSLHNLRQRTELAGVIRTFLQPGSDKELNIPPSMRDRALLALQSSSDPAHLQPIADHVYLLLKNCSHRNFVRLGVSNGTFETVCMATGLGIVLSCAGFLLSFLRAFVPHIAAHSRFNAFAAWPFWWLGMSLILSGLRGSCFFLLLFTRRQPLPWERFDDAGSVTEVKTTLLHRVSRLMIFDRKFKVEDAHLRRLQHKIVAQSLLGGAIFASVGCVFFFLLPVWNDSSY